MSFVRLFSAAFIAVFIIPLLAVADRSALTRMLVGIDTEQGDGGGSASVLLALAFD